LRQPSNPISQGETMKKFIIAGAVVAAALAGCSSSTDTASAPTGPAKVAPPAILEAGKLKVCEPNDGTPPGVFFDATGQLVGSEPDLAKAVADKLGLQIQVVQSAFAALIPTLQARQCDVIMGTLYVKPEREKVVDFVPYMYSGTGIALSKEHPADVTGMNETLCGKKVIVAVATTGESLVRAQSDKCTAAGKQPVDVTLNTQGSVSIQQVQNGQVDAYVDTAEALGYYEKQTSAQIKLAGAPFGTIKVGAAMAKGDKELQSAIDQAFKELIADGTYDKILTQWGQADLTIQK
jgi:polar amino acid transport system substrate-binding protein